MSVPTKVVEPRGTLPLELGLFGPRPYASPQGTQGEPCARESYGTLAPMTTVVLPSASLKLEVER
jgi:hypothetical protein